MNRKDHLEKAEAALGQAIAHLRVIGEGNIVGKLLSCEELILDLEEAEPHTVDPDPYLTSLDVAQLEAWEHGEVAYD